MASAHPHQHLYWLLARLWILDHLLLVPEMAAVMPESALADRYHATDDPYLCTWLVRHGVEPDGKALTQRGRVEFCFLKSKQLTKLLTAYGNHAEWQAFRLAHQRVWGLIESVRAQGRA